MTRLVLVLTAASTILATLALTFAGCGANDASTTGDESLANPEREVDTRPPTDAEARSFAEAVNLQLSDIPVPGFEVAKPERESTNEELTRCLDIDTQRDVAIESGEFEKTTAAKYQQIGSEVDVSPSAARAEHVLAEVDSNKGEECIKQLVTDIDTGGEYRLGNVQITPIPKPDSNEVAMRLETAVLVDEGEATLSVPIYFDFRAFADGPAAVSLIMVQSQEPPDDELGNRLVGLLRGRAEAHSLED